MRIYEKSVRFVIPNLKVDGALAIIWQNLNFLRRLLVFNFVLVPNPEPVNGYKG